MMEPIIELIERQTRAYAEEIDRTIMRAVTDVGVQVDKERLLQALNDARQFWYEGYNAALREQEQREQECEFCGGRHIITSVTVRHSMVGYDDVLGKVKVNFTETLKPPKHCPECGRKLSEPPKEGADHE